MNKYSVLGKEILDTYYICHKESELLTTFKDVVLSDKDPLKEKRIHMLADRFVNIGCASDFIIKHIENEIK